MTDAPAFPAIRDVGLSGLLVTFADTLSEPANRAALAFRAAVDAQGWDGVQETATSLASAFLRYDPLTLDRDALAGRLRDLLAETDWTRAPLPEGRRLWTIPVALGGDAGPQFDEAADAAGLTPDQAREEIAAARTRVLTIGFAPGQAYLGRLPEHWNIPRLQELTPNVPKGALVAAIRQLIVFARPTPTGWRHIGQTAFRSFRPDAETPFPLTPGDEIAFSPVPVRDIEALQDSDDGGATVTPIREEGGPA
ncbi:allophanate hydrolase subunit 1 [Psychromarinibacter sp. C21-152]|uniref:Allophanate hydrolase subunit 1 n=1 Tax=Psychromarinibacter sediminicola TaxID=3033385 RepID=A0AAE3T8R8_9RHOB|nr:allophanate hydrolase subunit 1 [Psychromarinibacter sediminicola]MDF0601013.1 allophanate hydrolase subunit 1 [Psychromarinibacter sediminicola]